MPAAGLLLGPSRAQGCTGLPKGNPCYYWGLCPQTPFIGPLKGPRITLALEGPAGNACREVTPRGTCAGWDVPVERGKVPVH